MRRWLRAAGNWFDARLSVRATLMPMMQHPIPRASAGPMGWWYVFGSASLTLLIVQIFTGNGLRLGDEWSRMKVIWKQYADRAPFLSLSGIQAQARARAAALKAAQPPTTNA